MMASLRARDLWLGVALVAVLLAGLHGTAVAVPFPYEGCEDYASGSNLDGASGGDDWTSDWDATGSHVTVQPKSLADPNGLVAGGAQAVCIAPTSNIADDASIMTRTFSAATGTLYVGLLLRVESFEGDDFLQIQLSDGAVGNSNETLSFGIKNRAGSPFFARVGQSGGTDETGSAANDTDYLLVAKFSKDGSGQYGQADLFINPSTLTEPMIADASVTSSVPSITQLTQFNVRVYSLETTDSIYIDQIRIADSFSLAIVPEPATLMLVGVGAGLGLLRRRRRV